MLFSKPKTKQYFCSKCGVHTKMPRFRDTIHYYQRWHEGDSLKDKGPRATVETVVYCIQHEPETYGVFAHHYQGGTGGYHYVSGPGTRYTPIEPLNWPASPPTPSS